MAPMLLGEGREMAQVGLLPGLQAALRWQFVDVQRVGEDLRMRLKRT